MSDRIFFSLAALAAVLMVAVALVYPQGIGKRSIAPFGHETYYAAEARKDAAAAEAKARARAVPLRAPPSPTAPMRGPH
jgi:hypothetical protein